MISSLAVAVNGYLNPPLTIAVDGYLLQGVVPPEPTEGGGGVSFEDIRRFQEFLDKIQKQTKEKQAKLAPPVAAHDEVHKEAVKSAIDKANKQEYTYRDDLWIARAQELARLQQIAALQRLEAAIQGLIAYEAAQDEEEAAVIALLATIH